MTVFVTQSDIQLSGPGLIGSDVAGSGVRRSKRIAIGAGLTLSGGVLTNTLDLSGYLPLTGGTLSGALGMPANQSIRWSESNNSRVTSPGTGTIDIYSGGFITRFSNGSVSAADWIGIGTDGNNPNVRLYHGGGNVIEQRNGLNAQCFDLFETYTSGTNNGKLRFKATSSGHQIGSARATSGSNRAVQLGHFDAAGAFTSAISVPSSGEVQIARNLVMSGTFPYFGLTASSWSGGTFYFQAGVDETGTGTGNFTCLINPVTKSFAILCGNPNTSGKKHLTIDGSTSLAVFGGAIVHVPASAVTLATNGQFAIEMTSNTAGNLVYRGSDGTTRRMALTFS